MYILHKIKGVVNIHLVLSPSIPSGKDINFRAHVPVTCLLCDF